MTDTMQAVVVYGPHDYRLERVPIPVPGPGEALVHVQAVGICASDLKCYHGAVKYWGDAIRPATTDTEVIPGHEFVGEIVAIDDQGRPGGVSMSVTVWSPSRSCPAGGAGSACEGNTGCAHPTTSTASAATLNGAMAEYMIYPADASVHKVSPGVPAAHAAFAEPLSCALHAVERARYPVRRRCRRRRMRADRTRNDRRCARQKPRPHRRPRSAPEKLKLALECGADTIINIATEDAESIVRRLTGGYGADIYLEASGHPSAVLQGLNLLRKLGTYVEYGVFGSEVSVDWSIISDDKELDIRGAHLGPHCWPTAIRMIESGALPMEQICTHQLPLDEFQKGLDLVGRGADSIKVTLLPGEGADM